MLPYFFYLNKYTNLITKNNMRNKMNCEFYLNSGYNIVEANLGFYIVFKDGQIIRCFYGIRKAVNYVLLMEKRMKYEQSSKKCKL